MDDEIDVDLQEATPSARRNRRGLAAGVGAAMLVAAAGGVGFGIGRSVDDGALSTGAEGGATVATVATEAPADPTIVPSPVEPTSGDIVGSSAPTPAADPAAPLQEELETGDVAADDTTSGVASGGGGWTMFSGRSDMELLAERTTTSGLVLRAHLAEVWGHDEFGGLVSDEMSVGTWTPAPWCHESGQVRIALGGGESTGAPVVDVGSVGWWEQPFEGVAVSWVTLGAVDGNPHRVVFVQVRPDVIGVTVTFDDGSVDSAVPENGHAILAVPGAPDTVVHDDDGYRWVEETPRFRVDFETNAAASTEQDETAAAIAPVVVDGSTPWMWDDPAFRESCSPPPPELPEPGEQPQDVDGATEQIVDRMSRLYGEQDGQQDGEQVFDVLDAIDDPTGVAEAREQVAEGSFEEAAAAARATVEDLVFTSPTDAWFRYRIETTTGTFGDRFGRATLIDGVWKIGRSTICQDLSLAGGDCGGDWSMVRPPGSESDF